MIQSTEPPGLLISCVLECHVDCMIVMLSPCMESALIIITTQWFELVPHCN